MPALLSVTARSAGDAASTVLLKNGAVGGAPVLLRLGRAHDERTDPSRDHERRMRICIAKGERRCMRGVPDIVEH